MPPDHRRHVAAWLRAIPQSRHEPLPPRELPHGELVGMGLPILLETWGAVELTDVGIRATSQPAYYFLHSLAAWLEAPGHVIEDWSEEHGARPGEGLKHGTSLVFLLEQERFRRDPDAPPIRFTRVAEVLIVRPADPPMFLVQWDERAGQYQIIGGRQKTNKDWEEPIEQTAIRELEEELCYQVSYKAGDFQLAFLAAFEGDKRLSPSFGALTAYQFTFFHARDLPPIELCPLNRWVTRAELLVGRTHDGQPVRGNHIGPLEAAMGRRIDTLPSSFKSPKD
ncbi:MAG TPA: NUDIX hydrolase [Anaerolineae bacterium]|nr:NUDIX hydrolase [Anaerolineae bacterium]